MDIGCEGWGIGCDSQNINYKGQGVGFYRKGVESLCRMRVSEYIGLGSGCRVTMQGERVRL